MRLLITGSSGMVGRNLLEALPADRHEVQEFSLEQGNLLDFDQVVEVVSRTRPDLIVHAAGMVGGIQANMANPVRFLADNALMGLHLVLAARQAGVTRLINLGSSCMYPRDAPNPLKEEMILSGQLEPTNEGYALAKIVTARLCQYVTRENPLLRYKTLVPCNLYGRWDKFDLAHSHMVPAVIRKLHLAKVEGRAEVDIWGDGQARREFMYAGDLAGCVVRAIDRFDSLPDLMNVGLGHDYTIDEYYQTVGEVVGYSGRFVHDLSKPVGMLWKLVSVDRLTAWGWQAGTSLRDGIARTYEFYLEHLGEDR